MPLGKAFVAHVQATPIIPNSLAIYGLGQMGFLIKGPDGVLVIDPCLSDIVRRLFGDWWARAYPPPVEAAELTNVTHCLITHEHLDHFDSDTITPLAQAAPNAHFYATGWCLDLFQQCGISPERYTIPPVLQSFTLKNSSARITAIPSAHYAKEYDAHKGYRWIGYLIEWNGVTLYHAGDTIIYEDYLEVLGSLPRPDVAIVPLNGRDYFRETEVSAIGNLLPNEGAKLAAHFGWDVTIIGHNDLYPNNAIPFGDVIQAFSRYAPRSKTKIVQPGELYYYVR